MSAMYGFWFTQDGRRLVKLHPWELAEAKRLWAKHADIRLNPELVRIPRKQELKE